MNVHRSLQHRIRRAGSHDVEYAVDRFVALGAEQRRADNLAALGIDHDLHET